MNRKSPPPLRVGLVSLGCAKNLVDSEKMLGQLAEAGCVITGDESVAEVMVINTCGFLESSRSEAHDTIADVVRRKAGGSLRRVVVAGCLVQRDGTRLLEDVPGIDALVGVNNRDDLVRAVLDGGAGGSAGDQGPGRSGRGRRRPSRNTDVYLSEYHPFVQTDLARLRLTPRHYAYLRISEGCDQKCTFCTIPSIRGPMHCKPPSVVLAEARELVSDGAVELNLIGQDTTSYGRGADALEGGLASLLRSLDQVEGVGWIRLMYAYPTALSDEVIAAIAECPRVCKYIDLPLQHINDRVLKAMHRRIDRRGTERLLEKLRVRIPEVTIRTTMIVGFPGESDGEFEDLVDFVRGFQFEALGVFPYSLEPETPAGRMTRQVSPEIKQARVNALLSAQQDVAFQLAERRLGRVLSVLVDERRGPSLVSARHQGQAPEVDSVTLVEDVAAAPGDRMRVRCTGRDGYDLTSVPVQRSLPVLGV